ncbi:hypothetical protein L1987_75823 [Smallanthus sonchifolius]|uniref:Uncharacterized protein n=1 Tax=Smallanthus sonchifolius TaxID=185202 RepID=A0ACB9A5T8_9ASTR|nr:hypothetical protein L1987_75823 [Smallanthus sonchifolius]
MVLSNKKLKQKLRSVLAESLANSESQANQSNLNDPQSHHSFKSLLNSVTQKPKLSKREIRRVKIPSLQPNPDQENGVEEKESEVVDGGLKKNNKRKREKDVNEGKDLSEEKSSKKKKKKIKKKKVVVVKKEEEGVKESSEEQDETEAVQIQTSKEDESICTKIYVGGIPYYSTVDDIQSFFEGCGSITEIDCLKFPETGKFNGIAMISFRTEAAAKRALALDGSDMGGLSLKIQPYKATRDKKVSDFAPAMLEGYNRIYVGNLSWDMTEDELKKFFSDCSISSIRLGKDKETGEFKGFAHVDFADSLSLTIALKLDQKPLFGRPGHLSSSCPNKKAVDVAHTGNITDDVVFDKDEKEVENIGDACPKKQAADVVKSIKEANYMEVEKADVAVVKEAGDNVVSTISEGKLRRRTCYECGERGHLSSLCPKKQAADGANSVKEANGMEVEKADMAVVKEESDNVVSSISEGKLRRRTCYECGERGHLSSLCPKKQAADVANSCKEADDMEVEEVKTTPVVSDEMFLLLYQVLSSRELWTMTWCISFDTYPKWLVTLTLSCTE